MKKRILTGITTTGTPHIGNYLGAIRPAIELSLNNEESFFFLADYHSIIKNQNSKLIQDSNEFYSLGFEYLFCLSSINGSGTGEFLDLLVEKLPKEDLIVSDVPKLAVIGRPNAGKSSFINSLIGKDRFIVTDVAGTTRDSLDTRVKKFGFDFILTDTAGIRKKKNVNEDLEFYSVMRSIKSIERSDVCILLIDAERGFESQDQKIFQMFPSKY